MRKVVATINSMHALPARALRLCLILILAACTASLFYTVTRSSYELEILKLQWGENVEYILTAINTALIGAFVFDLELKTRK